jgi:LacI family transcriptional regulator
MTEAKRIDGRRRRASMREVAELADVAISSVSRVLSDHPDVSTEMRARVLEAVDQLEYEPDFLAQSLRRGATLSVGYIVGDISNPLIATITSGAESVLRSAGYSMLLMNSENKRSSTRPTSASSRPAGWMG